MAYRRKKALAEPRKTGFALNVTSMTDMFTILLVFLLQTYATSDVEIQVEQGLRLPVSSSDLNPVKAVQISASSTTLKLNEQEIAAVKDGELDQQILETLETELVKLKTESDEGRLILLADQDLKFSTVERLLQSSASAGFSNVKLATVLGD